MTAPMSMWSDATDQARAIRSGDASALKLLDEALGRIDQRDTLLRAYVSIAPEAARDEAARVDERVRRGDVDGLAPFAGVTLSVKDVVDVAGLPTTHSCRALADHVAATDAPIVQRLRNAGFVMVGKTNVPEFCSSFTTSQLNGICRNPWNIERSPSGSSGGAAVALAAGMCAVAHGTDGAGSVRAPASFCGVVGLKPSRGRISFGPDDATSYFGTSVDGVLTRSVRDAAALLDVMAATSDRASGWSPRPAVPFAAEAGREPERLRIAVTTTFPLGEVEPEVAASVRATAELLASLGHHVDDATPNWLTMLAVAAGPMSVPGPAGLVGLSQLDLVEPRNRPLIESGSRLTVVEHAVWVDAVRAAGTSFRTFWDDWDVLVSPVLGIAPPPVSWAPWDQTPAEHIARFIDLANFAQPFNLSGQPAMSLPLAWSKGGLPIGIQIAGRPLAEGGLLRLAAQLEAARPWSHRRPPDGDARRD